MNEGKVYFTQLDGLRFLAILAVVEFHFVALLAPFEGFAGVNLFFVISGFLICQILLKSKARYKGQPWVTIRSFYIRRLLRIFPVYYLVIIVFYAFNAFGIRNDIYWLLSYTYNFKMAILDAYDNSAKMAWYYPHFWSLCVVEQFYLILPALILLFNRKHLKKIFFIMIGISWVFRIIMICSNPTAQLGLLPGCFDAFGAGCLLGYLFLYEKDKLQSILNKNYLMVLALLLYTVYIVIFFKYSKLLNVHFYFVLDRALFTFLAFFVVGKAATASYKGVFKLFLENSVIKYLGKISYGIYIYHMFVFNLFNGDFLMRIYKKYNGPVIGDYGWRLLVKYSPTYYGGPCYSFFYFSIITIVVSMISWHFFEFPINKLKNRFAV